MKVLSWNCRGIRSREKKAYFKDVILNKKIYLLSIQETKKCDFTNRSLSHLASHFDIWKWLPAVGTSGGILIG